MLKFKVPSSLLVSALEKISTVNSVVKIKRFSDNKITLSTSSEITSILIYVEAIVESEGSVVISCNKLLNICSSVKALFHIHETEKFLVINFNSNSHKIKKHAEPINFIKIDSTDYKEAQKKRIKIDVQLFCDSLKRAYTPSVLISKKEKMYLWQDAIFISMNQKDNKILDIKGAIGYALYNEKFELKSSHNIDNALEIISSKAATDLSKIFDDHTPECDFMFNDNWVCFKSDEVSYFTLVLNTKYPDFDGLLSKLNNYKFIEVPEVDLLVSSLKRISFLFDEDNAVNLKLNGNELELITNNSTEKITVINKDNLSFDFKLNTNFLLAVASIISKHEKKPGIKIGVIDSKKPVKISFDKYFFLISVVVNV